MAPLLSKPDLLTRTGPNSLSRPKLCRIASFVVNGSVPAWDRFADLPYTAAHDGLPPEYLAIDLALPDRVVPKLKAAACEFWLGHGFYETRGLIN